MKVLVITNLYPPEFVGGYELGCAQMVGALRGAGHDLHVLTSVSAHAAGREERGVDRMLEVPPIYNRARMQSMSAEVQQYLYTQASTVNPANTRAIAEALEEFEPDVAYLWNLFGVGGLGVLALLEHQGVPWVWHLMDIVPRELCRVAGPRPQLADELSRVFPGRYILCSSHLLGELRDGGIALGDRVTIVPNWTHGDPPAPRREFFAGGQLRLLSASGELCEPKGTHILIETAARLRDHGFGNFTIDLFGREDDARFRTLLYKHEVADIVRLMGSVSHQELLELYRSYDVFAFPTWTREPSAFAPLEAAAAGCVPLFTSDCGNAEWMIDGVDCLKARRTPDGFAVRIGQVLRGEVGLDQIGRRAQSVAWREFHVSRAARKVEEVLLEAADERRARRGPAAQFVALARFAEGLVQTLLAEA